MYLFLCAQLFFEVSFFLLDVDYASIWDDLFSSIVEPAFSELAVKIDNASAFCSVEAVPLSQAASSSRCPINMHFQPVLHLFLLKCASIDEYREVQRPQLRQWTEGVSSRRNSSYCILCVPGCPASIVEKARNEWGRCVIQVSSRTPALPATFCELLSEGLAQFVATLKADVNRIGAHRSALGWNIVGYWLAVDAVSSIYERFGLFDAALKLRLDALETCMPFLIRAETSNNLINDPGCLPQGESDAWMDDTIGATTESLEAARNVLQSKETTLFELLRYALGSMWNVLVRVSLNQLQSTAFDNAIKITVSLLRLHCAAVSQVTDLSSLDAIQLHLWTVRNTLTVKHRFQVADVNKQMTLLLRDACKSIFSLQHPTIASLCASKNPLSSPKPDIALFFAFFSQPKSAALSNEDVLCMAKELLLFVLQDLKQTKFREAILFDLLEIHFLLKDFKLYFDVLDEILHSPVQTLSSDYVLATAVQEQLIRVGNAVSQTHPHLLPKIFSIFIKCKMDLLKLCDEVTGLSDNQKTCIDMQIEEDLVVFDFSKSFLLRKKDSSSNSLYCLENVHVSHNVPLSSVKEIVAFSVDENRSFRLEKKTYNTSNTSILSFSTDAFKKPALINKFVISIGNFRFIRHYSSPIDFIQLKGKLQVGFEAFLHPVDVEAVFVCVTTQSASLIDRGVLKISCDSLHFDAQTSTQSIGCFDDCGKVVKKFKFVAQEHNSNRDAADDQKQPLKIKLFAQFATDWSDENVFTEEIILFERNFFDFYHEMHTDFGSNTAIKGYLKATPDYYDAISKYVISESFWITSTESEQAINIQNEIEVDCGGDASLSDLATFDDFPFLVMLPNSIFSESTVKICFSFSIGKLKCIFRKKLQKKRQVYVQYTCVLLKPLKNSEISAESLQIIEAKVSFDSKTIEKTGDVLKPCENPAVKFVCNQRNTFLSGKIGGPLTPNSFAEFSFFASQPLKSVASAIRLEVFNVPNQHDWNVVFEEVASASAIEDLN